MHGLKGVYPFLNVLLVFSLALEGFGMEISSTAFENGGKIPGRYTGPVAGGRNISFPLVWRNVPPGTKSFALLMVDTHPLYTDLVHWLVVNIPSGTRSLEEGASMAKMPRGSLEIKNSFGHLGYLGPEPPIGTGDHFYVITIYALSVERLDLKPDVSLSTFKRAIRGKIIDSATLTGRCRR